MSKVSIWKLHHCNLILLPLNKRYNSYGSSQKPQVAPDNVDDEVIRIIILILTI